MRGNSTMSRSILAVAILIATVSSISGVCPVQSAVEAGKEIPGCINDLFDSTDNASFVYATGGTTAEVADLKAYVEARARHNRESNPDATIRVLADTGFDESMWGHDPIYLYGPFNAHGVMKKWFSGMPVKIDDQEVKISGKELSMTYTGPNFGLISLWPQPGAKGYAVLYTGVSFKAVENINSVHHGPTDFVVFSGFSKSVGSLWSCSAMGFFDKSVPECWTIRQEDVTTGAGARAFFDGRFGMGYMKPGLPRARVSEITLKNGSKLTGKVFMADLGRVMIKAFEDKVPTGDIIVRKLSEIASINGTENLDSQIYRPVIADILQIGFSEFVDNSHVLSRGADFNIWQGTEPKWIDEFISTPKLTGPIHDLYGNTLEFTSVWNEKQGYHSNKADYVIPILPGGMSGTTSAYLNNNCVKDLGDGVFQYRFNHFPGPIAFVRKSFLLPADAEVVKSHPEPAYRTVTDRGTILTYEWLLAEGEGLFFDLKYKIPAKPGNDAKDGEGAKR